MDHISKALERTRAEQKQKTSAKSNSSVRDWIRPTPTNGKRSTESFEVRQVSLDRNIMRNNLVLGSDSDPVFVDRYRVLRTRMLQLMSANEWSSVGISSPSAKDGKTLTAINLAHACARDANNRTILIDVDLRRPSVANTLGLEIEKSIVHFLRGEAELGDVVVELAHQPNLLVIPCHYDEDKPAEPELVSSSKMDDLLNQIQQFDPDATVIVDFPPVLVGDDVIALAPKLDSVMLVVAEGQTDVDELTTSVELLSQFNLLGTVLNKSTETQRNVEGYYSYYGDSSRHSSNDADIDADVEDLPDSDINNAQDKEVV